MPTLTWLHLSDLHACRPRSGWDAGRVTQTLVRDLRDLQQQHGLRPDLIFFTGDAAFGHLGSEPGKAIEEQFREAGTVLDAVRGAFSPVVPKADLFLVPGNHDIDRRKVSPMVSDWLERLDGLDTVVRLIQDAGPDWQFIMQRLGAYQEFLREHGLGHLLGDPQRALWATVREVHGMRIGLAGFNSAWFCGRDGERGKVWAAGSWQQGTLREKLAGADLSLALMHHPPDWLREHEMPAFGRALRQDFQFLLHGHEHRDWVESANGLTTIAAAACYDRSDQKNGYNFVRLDLETGRGEVFLRQYDQTGGGWVPRPVHGFAPEGIWPLEIAATQPKRSVPSSRPAPLDRNHEIPELPHYLERLRAAHQYLPMAGFAATRVRLPIRLESVYVPLRARVVHHAMESEHAKDRLPREVALDEGKDREVPFDRALSFARKHGLRGAVVLGDPGTGKTTLLKHFVLAVVPDLSDPSAGPARLGLSEEIVPVLLELRRLDDPAAGLKLAVTGAVERTDPGLDAAAFAQRLLLRDYLLVLVDGLDEIADAAQRAEVSLWLEEAMGVLPYSMFVVTSRHSGYRGDARLSGRFLELHVRDLAEGEARRFIDDWYEAVEAQAELGRAPEVAARLASEGAEDLAARIFGTGDPRTANLRDLTKNPLLLQILCLVHRDRKSLPERRVELFGECCTVLLQLWREAKKLPVALSAAQAHKLLQPVAWWLHTSGRREAETEAILTHLAGPLRELGRDPAEGKNLLEAIHDQSGLLVSAGTSWSFLHLSFQEYLSARHVQDQVLREPGLLAELADHFGETWWREVILLAVGLDTPGLFEPLMAALIERQALQRDVRLADDVLRDASSVTARPLLAALAAGISSPEERYHALRLLRSISGWDAEGITAVRPLLNDKDRQVAGMAAELLGIERPAGRRRGSPKAGEERVNEVDRTVLLYVPGREYSLGAEDISEDEKPVHRVVLSPFWVAKYPVTNEQFSRFLMANPGAEEPAYWNDNQFNQPQQPVVGVSWKEAQAYCRWAGLCLPSEAQWEATARGTDGRRYPWGNDDPTPEHANCLGREGGTTPVGSYPKGAGPFGALDQAGNVWEWCEDAWDPAAYRARDGVQNPVFTAGNVAFRCLRGGSWFDIAGNLPAASRFRLSASYRRRFIGFRCLLPAAPES